MTTTSLNPYPSCPIRQGRRRRPYSLAAIGIGLLFWGIGVKVASSFVVETLGVDLKQAGQVTTEEGRHVHQRRR